ncbi:MAG: helix-turn-helix domain-containing protein [Clostridiales bacterium]|nr:helix-turn-helix domain-containing protein [Clostridiales bacterium]
MASVTQRINMIKQPYGGYLPIRSFYKTEYTDEYVLYEEENINAGIVGMAVDYLTRYMLGECVEDAFSVSLLGAQIIGKTNKAYTLLRKIKGLDSESIKCACKLSGFDVCFRAGIQGYKPIENINPDLNTIHNIRVMVIRAVKLFESIGPVTKTFITFDGGYTSTVDSGDGDFLTKNAIWDLKVSKKNPTSKHTLQLLMYYVLGLHSTKPELHSIRHLGIFNPRLNTAYTFKTCDISSDTIHIIESQVIGYGKNDIDEYIDEKPVSLTVAEASNYLGVNKTLILKMIREGFITATKVKNCYEIDEDAFYKLEKYVRRRQIMDIVMRIVGILFVFALIIIILDIMMK